MSLPNNTDQPVIIIIGATSAMAEQCARIWISRHPCRLLLVGRNPETLQALQSDLSVRSADSTIDIQVASMESATEIKQLTEKALTDRKPDIVLIAHGTLPDQHTCQSDIETAEQAMYINGLSPALLAESFIASMQQNEKGTLAVIGSVAGDRGRKSNYVYGAAKGLVTRYLQGLQHRLANSNVNVVIIKPGPTDTPMTAHLKADGLKMASSKAVAADIVHAIDQKKPVCYTPGKWALIMMIIRHLPRFIFNKMDI